MVKDLVLISTHRLAVAGSLRRAFQGEGFSVDLIPSPEHLPGRESSDPSPALMVLTGEGEEGGEAWVERLGEGGVPLFTLLPGGNGRSRGTELGAVEVFGSDPSADEVALVGRRTVDRRRLQSLTGIVGESEAIRELLERVVQVAPVDSTVLVTGESGTGKELVARGLHALSPRRHRGFLAVNVAALSDTLLESELFGHEKGAFTGAIDARKGFFELAHKGTLFLDEIGELPLSTQTKLLRVLEQREFLRVGGEKPIQVDVRIVAATNRELRPMVATGEFRRDLYYRLNILDLRLPPLRERREDIPRLIRHFVDEVTQRIDRPFPGIEAEALEILVQHDWPGNVRELRNLVESMVVLSPGRRLRPSDLPREIRGGGLPPLLAPPRGERGESPLLPVPAPSAWVPLPGGEALPRGEGGGELRPELQFIFRTLVELRVDMEQLRREFERYRSEVSASAEATLEIDPERWPTAAAEDWAPFPESGSRGGARGGRGPEEGPPSPLNGGVQFRAGMTIDDLEEAAIRQVLREVGGNRRLAAEQLGIGERTLYRKIQKYGIDA